jgi:hypothetical protein
MPRFKREQHSTKWCNKKLFQKKWNFTIRNIIKSYGVSMRRSVVSVRRNVGDLMKSAIKIGAALRRAPRIKEEGEPTQAADNN